jgi:glycosyltransferase involved in cell wall biosynthesis
VIVDDGSSPPVSAPQLGGTEVRLIRQENRGRFEARRAGIEAARGAYVLLLDSRVTLDPESLRWVAERVADGDQAWNGHCVTGNLASPYARFSSCRPRGGITCAIREPRRSGLTSTTAIRRARRSSSRRRAGCSRRWRSSTLCTRIGRLPVMTRICSGRSLGVTASTYHRALGRVTTAERASGPSSATHFTGARCSSTVTAVAVLASARWS